MFSFLFFALLIGQLVEYELDFVHQISSNKFLAIFKHDKHKSNVDSYYAFSVFISSFHQIRNLF